MGKVNIFWKWLKDNKEWVFSGIGVLIFSIVVSIVFFNSSEKKEIEKTINIEKTTIIGEGGKSTEVNVNDGGVVNEQIVGDKNVYNTEISETKQNIAERGSVLTDIGYNLYVLGLGKKVKQDIEIEIIKHKLEDLYSRLGLSIPDVEVGLEMFKVTDSMLVNKRERLFLKVGAHLAMVYSIGLIIIHHRGTNFETQGREKMPEVIHNLKIALMSLGIFEDIKKM